jgi:hypothetical protein
VLLFLAATACAPDQTADEAIPLEVVTGPRGSVLAFVPVFIDGQGPVLFALDTGSSETLIDRGVAEDMGL